MGQWDKLFEFIRNGAVPIDNKFMEAHIRPFVIGRNAWMFSDTPAGADASASLYPLIETSKTNGIDPHDYLTLIFKELPLASTADALEKLLPYHAKKHFPFEGFGGIARRPDRWRQVVEAKREKNGANHVWYVNVLAILAMTPCACRRYTRAILCRMGAVPIQAASILLASYCACHSDPRGNILNLHLCDKTCGFHKPKHTVDCYLLYATRKDARYSTAGKTRAFSENLVRNPEASFGPPGSNKSDIRTGLRAQCLATLSGGAYLKSQMLARWPHV